MPLPLVHPRHARLFELIRQQGRAERVARHIDAAPAVRGRDLAAIARRAAASWRKMS